MKSAFGYRARGPGDMGCAKKDQMDPVRGPGRADAFFLVDVSDSPLSAFFIHEVVEIDFIIEIVVR
ncbi:MAG TPA: hypothetical protein ENN52_00140 [Methanofollis liminatans]|uniref:Uncharacterized protein n=1 Tax=Methanofollis liminatans TaxID=2201 RepID=A0A831PKR2_9EURY|nr:hypothetical protein [Methanofollis liminatans]